MALWKRLRLPTRECSIFGIGLDIYANRNWLVGLESSYVLGAGDLWEADYASLGVGIQYRF